MSDDWIIREPTDADRAWMAGTLADELEHNSYLHGIGRERCTGIASRVLARPWLTRVIAPSEDSGAPCGWVIYESAPTLTVLYAFVDRTFRGLGAWRALADEIGLRRGHHVAIVLGSPKACAVARTKYAVKHNWGRVLEWLT